MTQAIRTSSAVAARLTAAALLAIATMAHADREPNDRCTSPDSAILSAPFSVFGQLEARPGTTGDIDFYTLTGIPDTPIEVSLTGDPGAADTLLGYFGSDCRLVAVNDDTEGLDAQLSLRIPRSGALVLAVSGSGDADFSGSHLHSGSYELSAAPVEGIGAIRGDYFDAATGVPPAQASATLYRCADADADAAEHCSTAVASADASGGAYSFMVDGSGIPLKPGRFRVAATFLDVSTWSEPFRVAAGEDYRVPTLYHEEPPGIGVHAGRVVDTDSGAGLSGDAYPSAFVRLLEQGCDADCGDASTMPDAAGYFRFEPWEIAGLRQGTYTLSIAATDYETLELRDIPSGGEGETIALGELALRPKPVRIAVNAPCERDAVTGGRCRYRIRVINRSAENIRGALWSIGMTYAPNWTRAPRFPIGQVVPLTLRAGEDRFLYFELDVPPTLPDGGTFCAVSYFAEGDVAQPLIAGADAMFCLERVDDELQSVPKDARQAVLGRTP